MATPAVFFPGESHGQRSLAGCSLWDHMELVMTERFSIHAHIWRMTFQEGVCVCACLYTRAYGFFVQGIIMGDQRVSEQQQERMRWSFWPQNWKMIRPPAEVLGGHALHRILTHTWQVFLEHQNQINCHSRVPLGV